MTSIHAMILTGFGFGYSQFRIRPNSQLGSREDSEMHRLHWTSCGLELWSILDSPMGRDFITHMSVFALTGHTSVTEAKIGHNGVNAIALRMLKLDIARDVMPESL